MDNLKSKLARPSDVGGGLRRTRSLVKQNTNQNKVSVADDDDKRSEHAVVINKKDLIAEANNETKFSQSVRA